MPSPFDWLSKLVELAPSVVRLITGSRSVPAPRPRSVPIPPPRPARVTRPRRMRPRTKPSDHHVWDSWEPNAEGGVSLRVPPRCDRCDVDQTADNRFAVCGGRAVARWADD